MMLRIFDPTGREPLVHIDVNVEGGIDITSDWFVDDNLEKHLSNIRDRLRAITQYKNEPKKYNKAARALLGETEEVVSCFIANACNRSDQFQQAMRLIDAAVRSIQPNLSSNPNKKTSDVEKNASDSK